MSEKSKTRFRPAGSRVGDGEIETSTAERVLAFVLAVFIAIGAFWAYDKLDEVAKPETSSYLPNQALVDREELTAITQHREAIREIAAAERERRTATRRLEFRREAYRTALDAGEPSAELQAGYESAQAGFASTSQALKEAAATEAQTKPAAAQAEAQADELREDAAAERDDEQTSHDRIVFLLRLALLIVMLAISYRLLIRLRSRNSRYLPAALALIGATAVLAIGMAGDYTGSYLAFDEVGPLAISIAGIALTLAAFVALQRFLAKRVPARRVRRGECSFCGFPLRGTAHCEGCGRAAIAACSNCGQDRRVGTPRCGHCGNP
ncbi:MAG TPA: zinc ribbon domain-containing protein [Solirubrobacterales bacterium]|nr:zinc ribbon domain-containing protein [Solirubrobacterales bacterium]